MLKIIAALLVPLLVPPLTALCATTARAAWPEKPIRFIVPSAPGGSPDVLMVAEAGVPGCETVAWGGVIGPAGLSKEVMSHPPRQRESRLRWPGSP